MHALIVRAMLSRAVRADEKVYEQISDAEKELSYVQMVNAGEKLSSGCEACGRSRTSSPSVRLRESCPYRLSRRLRGARGHEEL